MNDVTYEIIGIGLNLLNTYIVFCMMRLLNKSNPYNKRIEFLSYIFTTLANILMVRIFQNPWLISITMVVMIFLTSLNYRSNIRTKIASVLLIFIISSLCELIVLYLLEPSLIASSVPANEAMIHLHLYYRILEVATVTFFVGAEDRNTWIGKSF